MSGKETDFPLNPFSFHVLTVLMYFFREHIGKKTQFRFLFLLLSLFISSFRSHFIFVF